MELHLPCKHLKSKTEQKLDVGLVIINNNEVFSHSSKTDLFFLLNIYVGNRYR